MRFFMYAMSAVSFIVGALILLACMAYNTPPIYSLPFMVVSVALLMMGDGV
jgi:hypothetical protein